MKTLIYDNECPLCVAYTSAFVTTGILEKEGRQHFNEVSPAILAQIDKSRIYNEIPLIENETGKVWYGIDALLELLGSRIPLIKKIGKWTPVNWFLKKLYKLVSYNRKVIVAVNSSGQDCNPDFNIRYRILFLLIGLVFNSLIYTRCLSLFNVSIFPAAATHTLQAAHFSFVAVNICIAIFLGKKNGLEYLGQVNMLALITLLLLIPITCLQNNLGAVFIGFSFGAIFFFISREYIRRMKYAGIITKHKSVVALNVLCICSFFLYLLY